MCGFVIALANGSEVTEFVSEACATGNATDCAEESSGSTDFLDTLRSIDAFTFQGAPTEINAIWVSVLVLLIVGAILSIVFFFIPATSE